MDRWWINGYVSPEGKQEFFDWFNALKKRPRLKFLQRMARLSVIPKREWRTPKHYPYAKNLEKKGKPLWEIRFLVDSVQWRPLGYFGPADVDFTFLLGATEKGDGFKPRDAVKQAQNRRRKIEKGEATAKWIKELSNSSSEN